MHVIPHGKSSTGADLNLNERQPHKPAHEDSIDIMALELQENTLCRQKVGWVPLMIVNTAFLEMLHNWFLLIRKNLPLDAEDFISCTLFLCTDLKCTTKLRENFKILRTYQWMNSMAIEGEMKYGTNIYFQVMSSRLKLVRNLLSKGVSVALIEADQVFLKNPFRVINALEDQQQHDMITYDDGRNIPCFGFLFLRPTKQILESWSKLIHIMEASPQNEQLLMQKIIGKSSVPSVRYLPKEQFQSGFAFKQQSSGVDMRSLVMMHANWVIGTTEKMKMLKRHGWWLVTPLDETTVKTKAAIEFVKPDLRIIVLTQKRAISLARLLKSLSEAEYHNDRVDIDIWVDWIDDAGIRSAITNVINAYTWNFGRLRAHYRNTTVGLRRQWFETWNLSVPGGLTLNTKEHAIILEDDVEVSIFFWLWLRTGHKQYMQHNDIAGFSLQRLNLCANFCPAQNGGPVPDNTNFLHPLVGSWGYSPTVHHWLNFTNWVRAYEPLESTHKPYVRGTQPTAWYKDSEKTRRCPGPNCMWTQLHHFYTSWAPDRYTVYAKCEGGFTLATNHQEKGLHYGKAMHADFPRLGTDMPERLLKFEQFPTIVGLDGKVQPKTKIQRLTTVPIVLVAINYRIKTSMLLHTLRFMCIKNDIVVVLTNVQENMHYNNKCIQIIDVSDKLQSIRKDIQFLSNVAANQQIFFIRWYTLKYWMRLHNVDTIFTMDSDAIMTENITHFIHSNKHILSKHALWVHQSLPRTSFQFAIMTQKALTDLLNFWNNLLLPEIWTTEFRNDHEPNDMVALGHYVHMKTVEPFPCWGFGPKRKNGTCEYGYNIKKILQNIQNAGIRAKYSVGNLGPDVIVTQHFNNGFVDINYKNNDANFYATEAREKVLRFNHGNVELLMHVHRNDDKNLTWVRHWGYVLEDETEKCAAMHINRIENKHSCICKNWCCFECTEYDKKKALDMVSFSLLQTSIPVVILTTHPFENIPRETLIFL